MTDRDVLTETEKAYLAGLIDADGCIYIASVTVQRRTATPTISHRLTVTITQVNEPFLRYWQERTGLGNIYDAQYYKEHGNQSQAWTWRLDGVQVEPLLCAILPYLHLKKTEAELALEFRATITHRGGSAAVLPHILRQRVDLAERLKQAKKDRKGKAGSMVELPYKRPVNPQLSLFATT